MKSILLLLFFATSIFAQLSWTPIQNLSSAGHATSDYQTLISDGSNFHLVWGENGEIKYRYSSNSGVTWSAKANVPNSGSTCGWPVVAASGSNIYVMYHCLGDYNIYFNKSTNYGATWTFGEIISSAQNAITPQIVVDGDTVYGAWEERINTNYEIYFRRSVDAGQTWGTLTNLTNNPTFSRWVQLEKSNGVLYMAWLESPAYPASDIYFSKSFNNGESWTTPVNLTNDVLPQLRLDMKILDSSIYIVSQDQLAINADEIGFMKSTDLGATWTTPVNLSNNAGNSSFPNILPVNFDNTHHLFLSWPDNTGTPGNLEIYFKYSTDEGATWSSEINLSNNAENSYRPHIVASSYPGVDSIGIAWYDYSLGASEILFRRGLFEYIIPVELPVIEVSVNGFNVTLKWSTVSEKNNKGFYIYRKQRESSGEWQFITFVKGKGTTLQAQSYSFEEKIYEKGAYSYRIIQADFDGTETALPDIEFDLSSSIEFSLFQNYPNPFNPSTKIKFSIHDGGSVNVSLKIYDILGNEAAVLIDEAKSAGEYEIEFSASAYGLSSGVYFYKLTAGEFSAVKKLMLVR
jgi:hypothetical protein